MTSEKIIVNKSTVPIGTNLKAQKKIEEGLNKREIDLTFDIVSNPEFLREGCAIEDFLKPDRVIIGTDSEKTKKEMTELYSKVGIDSKKMIYMSPVSAELTKYSANGFLATKISFINEIANLAEKVGADINEIKLGIGTDERIGKHFLNAGCGYGGSCFPKDIDALIHMSKQIANKELELLQAVREVNIKQKLILFKKLELFFDGSLNNKKIAIWGLSFKPDTDDMRESPSITLIEKLIQSGSKVFAHDPEAIEECKKLITDDKVVFCENIEDTTKNADAIVIVTDWEIYKEQDFSVHGNNLRRKLVLDGRNCLDKKTITDLGFEYSAIGR
jgi:UDPglucose 6-dehydrogenase